jgi:hypothetical membrane protein
MGNLTTLTNWLKTVLVPLAILAVGVIVMSRSHKKDHHGALVTFGIVLLGLALVGVAVTPGAPTTISSWLVRLVTG